MIASTLGHISPHLLGIFMLGLACVPLIFVWQDSHRRQGEKKRLSALRREVRLAAQLRGPPKEIPSALVQGWGGEARR